MPGVNRVLYNLDQRGETTPEERTTARRNIDAISADEVAVLFDDRYKVRQSPIDMTFASNAVLRRLWQNPNGEIGAECNYIYNATQDTAGLMSPEDKAKLDGIAYGAEVNVQSDWNVNDESSDAFIRNRPNLSVFVTHDELGARLDTKQDVLTPGRNITIENNVISASADPQVQADWAQNDSSAVDYIKNRPQNLVQDPDYVHTDNNFTDADKTKLACIEAGAEVNVKPDWDAAVGSDAEILNKPQNLVQDADYHHTDNNYTTAEKNKLAGIEAGAEVNVNADWNASAGSDAEILNKPDLSVYATKTEVASDLADKQDKLTAGSNITITNNVISATAAPQQNADWNATSGVTEILNKPQNLVQDADYVHTDNNFTTAEKNKLSGVEAGAEVNVNADWSQSDSAADDFIKNKPQNLVQDASYVHTDNNFTTSEKDKLAGIAAGAEVNVQADWTEADSAADSFIKHKPNLAAVATSGDYNDLSNRPAIIDNYVCYIGSAKQALWNAWLGGKLIFFVTRTDLSQFASGSYGKERIIPLYSVTPTQSSGHTVYVFRFARTSYVEEPGYSAVEQYSVQIDPSDLTGNLVGGFETVYERSFTVISGTIQKDLYEAMTQGCAIEYMDGNHALYNLSAVIPDTGDTGYNFVFTRVGCSAAAGSPVTIDTATVRITSPSSTSAVVITANAPIGFPLMQWQQQTQGATNTYSADKLSIHQDSHTVTMHDATNGDVDLGYVVPVVAAAPPTNKILTMASGNTVPTWSDAPEGHTVGFITVP